jgi:hypothetical protein
VKAGDVFAGVRSSGEWNFEFWYMNLLRNAFKFKD